MGISKLNEILKEHSPNSWCEFKLSTFKYHRIAIDAGIWLYQQKAKAQTAVVAQTNFALNNVDQEEVIKKWWHFLLNFVQNLLKMQITPVIVFDGKKLPDKSIEMAKRSSQKSNDLDKLHTLLTELREMNPLLACKTDQKQIKTLAKRCFTVKREEVEHIKNILRALGIPIIQANYEADMVCAALCLEGHVSAVYSTDTDQYALGCPLLLTEIKNPYLCDIAENGYEMSAYGRHLEQILHDLQMTQPEFVDMCILTGCDFNNKIRGVSIKTAYKLIKAHERLENLPVRYDLNCLRYIRCRQLFSYRPLREHVQGDIHLNIIYEDNQQAGIEILSNYGLAHLLGRLQDTLLHLSRNSHGVAANLDLRYKPLLPIRRELHKSISIPILEIITRDQLRS